MYRFREMTIDDKVCEQVSMTMLGEVYPQEVIERRVQQSEPWRTKVRRVRLSTALPPGAVCDRPGAVEPAQSVPGVEQAGRASSAICIRHSPTVASVIQD